MSHPLIRSLMGIALALSLAGTPWVARAGDAGTAKAAPLYPNATRQAPKLDLTSKKESDALNAGMQAASAGDKAKATELLQPIIEQSKSKYAQALALQAMANLKYNEGDIKGAIGLLQQSLANGVMPNDTYFQLEYELAQMYTANQQYQASLDQVAKWRAEGKKETAESYALEGNDYYRLQKYPEAIAAIKKAQSLSTKPHDDWNQILMASYAESGQTDQAAQMAEQVLKDNPNDPHALRNAFITLVQAQKYDQAVQLMDNARSQGKLTTQDDYIDLVKAHLLRAENSNGQDPKADTDAAVQALQEGMAKGVVAQDAGNYKLMGDAYMLGGEPDKALAAYQKAIPSASDGEPAYDAAYILLGQNKYAQAKDLLQQALAKGVKHKGKAYLMMAKADQGLKDKTALIQDLKMAAQDPETASQANELLQHRGKK